MTESPTPYTKFGSRAYTTVQRVLVFMYSDPGSLLSPWNESLDDRTSIKTKGRTLKPEVNKSPKL